MGGDLVEIEVGEAGAAAAPIADRSDVRPQCGRQRLGSAWSIVDTYLGRIFGLVQRGDLSLKAPPTLVVQGISA